MQGTRLDKWLWAARFYKTRSLASEEIGKGRVAVNGQVAKPAREVRTGDSIELRQGSLPRTVRVLQLSSVRGPASVARELYEESPQSIARREQAVLERRHGVEPAHAIEQGRPTKRDRRQLVQWNRWSASIDAE